MGVSHFQVSEVPKSEKVFSLGSKSLENFQMGGETVQVLTLLPPGGINILSGVWPLATLRALKVIILS
jgi:hypothetical protein